MTSVSICELSACRSSKFLRSIDSVSLRSSATTVAERWVSTPRSASSPKRSCIWCTPTITVCASTVDTLVAKRPFQHQMDGVSWIALPEHMVSGFEAPPPGAVLHELTAFGLAELVEQVLHAVAQTSLACHRSTAVSTLIGSRRSTGARARVTVVLCRHGSNARWPDRQLQAPQQLLPCRADAAHRPVDDLAHRGIVGAVVGHQQLHECVVRLPEAAEGAVDPMPRGSRLRGAGRRRRPDRGLHEVPVARRAVARGSSCRVRW